MTDIIHQTIKINSIGDEPTVMTLDLKEKERKELAEKLDIHEIQSLVSTIRLSRSLDGRFFTVQLHIESTVVIKDDFTKEDIPISIEETEEEFFTTDPDLIGEDVTDVNAPELIKNEEINLGEIVYDYFVLFFEEKRLEIALAQDAQQLKKIGDIEDKSTKKEDTYRPFADLKDILSKKNKKES